jgi:hypothetical protein
MIIFLRSLVFNVGLWLWTALVGIVGLPTLLGPYSWSTAAILVWARGVPALKIYPPHLSFSPPSTSLPGKHSA